MEFYFIIPTYRAKYLLDISWVLDSEMMFFESL
jgi:hypothetical protein